MIALERVKGILDRMRHCHVAVIGDAILDSYLSGDVDRISPEAPVPVVRVHDRRHVLGGAANVAANVAAIGSTVSFIGVIGDDRRGEQVHGLLALAGIEHGGIVVERKRLTTLKTRVVARGQQVLRIDEETDAPLQGDTESALIDAARREIARADVVVIEDYNKGVLTPTLIGVILDAAKNRRIPSVVDPKFRNFFAYGGATVFKPNRRELELALGSSIDLDQPDTVPMARKRLGVQNLLLTLGAQGMVLCGRDGIVAHIPTVARDVFDVSGAGDTAAAWTGAALAAGASIRDAAELATFAAGVEVGKLGVASVTCEEVVAVHEALRTLADTRSTTTSAPD